MNCMKQLGQKLMSRDFDRQTAELQVRIAIPLRDMPSGLAIEFLSAAYRDHHPLNLFVSDMRSALTLMTISLPLSWTMRTSKVSLSLHCLI